MGNNPMIQLTDRKRTFIFINLVISGIATSILATAMNTALPSLSDYFGVSTSIGQWVTSGYSLAMGMVVPLTAFLITRFPTKKLYMGYQQCGFQKDGGCDLTFDFLTHHSRFHWFGSICWNYDCSKCKLYSKLWG